MVKKTDKYEYTTRDFSAVDKQVEEFARRERELTNKIRQDNLRKLSITSVIFAGAIAIVILAIGIALWLFKKQKIVEVIKEPKVIVQTHQHSQSNERNLTSNQNIRNQKEGLTNLSDSERIRLGENLPNRLASIQGRIGKKLNFALIWNNLNDLDLHLVTPDGKEINYNNRTWNGGYLDYDKNVDGKAKTRTPIENIRWDNDAPKGIYKVYINLFSIDKKSNSNETDFQIAIHNKNNIEVAKKYKIPNTELKKKIKLFDYEVQ